MAGTSLGTCLWNSEHLWNPSNIKFRCPKYSLEQYERSPDGTGQSSHQSFVDLIKACSEHKDIDIGNKIHAEVSRNGLLETDIFIGSTMVEMYSKCESLAKAKEVFDKLQVRNVFTWNALIGGYVQHERGKEALNCFDKMQSEGVSPDAVSFTCSLKACALLGARDKGLEIHSEISKRGLVNMNAFVGNMLVDMYAKFGMLGKARGVLDMLPARNVVTWTAIIAGYAQHGCGDQALHAFEQMRSEGLCPGAATYACIFKACGNIGAIDKGSKIHEDIASKGLFKSDVFVGSTLVDMYAKCGFLAKAQEVFNMLSIRNVVTWTSLIAGYVVHERNEEALYWFDQMKCKGICPNEVTFTCIAKACANMGAADKGDEMCAEVSRIGLLQDNPSVGNALVDMYAKCSLLAKAQAVFDVLPVRNVVAWTALVFGYAEEDCCDEALRCLEQMQIEGIFPDAVMFACGLKACSGVAAFKKGRELHAKIVLEDLLQADVCIGSTLVDMYAKSGSLTKAQEAFDMLTGRNVVTWNALVGGYLRHERAAEALDCVFQMQLDAVSPDAVTFTCSLKACGLLGATDMGMELHAEVSKNGIMETELSVGNALIDMYAKCGLLAKAMEVFDMLSVKDVVSWNALMAGFVQHDGDEETLICFEQMQMCSISPDGVTFTCILKACCHIGATEKGRQVHAEIGRKGLLATDLFLGSVVVDMYSKGGLLSEAREVFEELAVMNVVTWNALITGLSQTGELEVVLSVFNRMTREGNIPDSVTFVSVLNCCTHAGVLDMGCVCFEAMGERYGITPMHSHYTCMIDLFGRAGQLHGALLMMKKAPFHPSVVMWLAILGSSRKWANVELGRHAFEQVVCLDEKHAASYICMSNMYADAGMQDDARKIDTMRVERQAWKMSGECWWD